MSLAAGLSATTKTSVLSSSSLASASATDSSAAVSAFWIVPIASASAMSAPEALLRVSVSVSPPSSTVSSVTGTETVCVVSPGSNVSVPLVAV